MSDYRHILAQKKGLFKNMILYGFIGCFASGVDALVFFLLNTKLGLPWQYANVISVLTGMTVSFILNRRFNFKVFDNTLKRAAIFLCVGLCGLLLSQILIAIFTALSLNVMVSKLISIVFVAAFQFVLNKLVSFGYDFSKERKNSE